MPTFNAAYVAFTAGELSDRVNARVDLARYPLGLKTCENMVIQPQGPATRRPGTVFVANTRENAKARLMPFRFGSAEAYVLELTDSKMRFYRNRGQILSGGTPYEIDMPWAEVDLFDLQVVQSADVMYVVNRSYKTQKLSRSGDTNWTVANYAPTGDPFTSANNYPGAVGLFEQRLWLGSTNNDPSKLWASGSGNFEQLTAGIDDDDPFSYVIAGQKVQTVRWISANKNMFLGTTDSILQVESTQRGPITPTDISIRPIEQTGSEQLQPVGAKSTIMYPLRGGRRMHELSYSLESDGVKAGDVTLIADHVMRSGIVQMDYQSTPDSTVWVVRNDGVLLSLTYDPLQEVLAWSRHILGGTDVVVESVATIPKPDGSGDDVWLSVKRTINGETVRFVEYLSDDFGDETDIADAWFVDAGLQYDGAETTTLTGLDHLEGETVDVLADGTPKPQATVVDGQITISPAASKVTVGLPYTSTIRTMPLEPGLKEGNRQGKPMVFSHVYLRLYRSVGGRAGSQNGSTDRLKTDVETYDTARAPFTGTTKAHIPGGWSTDNTLTVVQDQPLPFTLQGIFAETGSG